MNTVITVDGGALYMYLLFRQELQQMEMSFGEELNWLRERFFSVCLLFVVCVCFGVRNRAGASKLIYSFYNPEI
jgi:hypothetical protein